MLHEKYENMISEYIDGELCENEKSELMNHLERCPDCAAHYAFVKKLSESLPEAGAEPSPDFACRIMSMIDEAPEARAEENKLIKLLNKKNLALAACLALIVISAVFLAPNLGGMKDAAPEAALPQDKNFAAEEEKGEEMTACGIPEPEEKTADAARAQSIGEALGEIADLRPAVSVYDSSGNVIYESPEGAKLIDALLSESKSEAKKELSPADFELVLTSDGEELRLNVCAAERGFYLSAGIFSDALRVEKNFSDFISKFAG